MENHYQNIDEMKFELDYLKQNLSNMYYYHSIYNDNWDECASIENEINIIKNEIADLERYIAKQKGI